MTTSILACLLMIAMPGPSASPGVIAAVSTSRSVVVDGDRITFGDISPTAPRELLGVDLGPSPAPGARTQITRAAVADALRRSGGDPELATGVPVRQSVQRAATKLSLEDLDAEVRSAALAQLPLGVDIDQVLGLRAVMLPPGDHTVVVSLGRVRRSTRATIEVNVGARRWASISATISLSGTARTPVLKKTMAPGATVDAGHVTLREVEIDDLPEGAITRTDQLVGKRLKTRQTKDAPLRQTSTEATPIVTRGSTLEIVVARPGVRISRQAIAQQDGAIGESIRVKPVDDDRVLVVRVEEDGTGRVVSRGGAK